MKQYSSDLDTPLLEFPGNATWTIRQAIEGLQIFGGIGSGKSSGSGRLVALKYLLHGFGGLVLTAKPDEVKVFQGYCRETNRLDDLIIIQPGKKNFFNFFEYESASSVDGNSITQNLVEVLKTIIKAGEEQTSGHSDSGFWDDALDLVLFNCIDLCLLAYKKISVQDLYDIALYAPKPNEQPQSKKGKTSGKLNPYERAFEKAQQRITVQVDEWILKRGGKTIEEAEDEDLYESHILEEIPDARLLKSIDQFFSETYRNLHEKTRSIVDFSFHSFLFRLLRDPIHSLFCRHPSNVTPEDCLRGKIILLNIPVKTYHKFGRDSQLMFKYIWQRSMEKREISSNSRPVFLWADESQNFLHEHDATYQATARSSRIATVYISQNLNNYYASMGGSKSEYRVKSFLGTLSSKIFHANADLETNRYAADLIGEAYSEDVSQGRQHGEHMSMSTSSSFRLEKMVRPEKFVGLRTGGPRNSFWVEGYIHIQGNSFPDGFNFKAIRLRQQSNR